MAKQDYYKTLGVDKQTSPEDIKKAYRKVAMKYHPDRNQGDKTAEGKFKEASEAYEILSNPGKKEQYDLGGMAGVHQQNFKQGQGFGFANFSGNQGFEDIFSQFFGQQSQHGQHTQSTNFATNRSVKGRDLNVGLTVSFADAINGCTKNVTILRPDICDVCNGKGINPAHAHRAPTCGACQGTGQMGVRSGILNVNAQCNHCGGRGILVDPDTQCLVCRGHGRVRKEKTLSVNIPPGVDTGNKIKLAEQGEAGPNMHNSVFGDLYVTLAVTQDKRFKREGVHLHCSQKVRLTDLFVGGDYDIETLDGTINLKVPPNTQPGTTMRVVGKGVKSLQQQAYGDLLVKIEVDIPEKLNREQKRLIDKLRNLGI